ncbi:MAG: glycosyl hydrolase [Candidatus Aminicenantes bacterium]|nr:glycosyl hydrolase [Candidatus Aminicenantes bacterium]
MKYFKFWLCFLIAVLVFTGATASAAIDRLASYEKHLELKRSSIFKQLQWESLGPYFTGGRIDDIEAYEDSPNTFFVAAASGGLWKTVNNATTWESLFDFESSISIGDIALSQRKKNLIWVGSGEANSSRSSYPGTGVFKSTDSGKTWEHMGLQDTYHISRVIIDPLDSNTVYVAALGHLYTENEERGLFKTTDSGKTWQKILYISPKTGISDLIMHPKNNKILYAASWQKERKPWNLEAGGEESAIYKTTDGGLTWNKKVAGFPQNMYVGRIGLTICPSHPETLYALLDNQEPRPITRIEKTKGSGIVLEDLLKMSAADFLKIDPKRIGKFLKENRATKVFDAKMVQEMVRTGEITPRELAYIIAEDKEDLKVMVVGAEVYRSDNGGESWAKTHQKNLSSGIYKTYGFYFGQVRVDPVDKDTLYILGIPVLKSTNGGRTFEDISIQDHMFTRGAVHVDAHAMWIDPKDPRRILLGTDGGLNISYDGGVSWQKIGNLPLAQCYTVNYDLRKPYYNIYTGLQDNGVVMGPRNFSFGSREYMWHMILGADGALVEAQKDDPNTIYAASQFGALFRVDMKKKVRYNIKPEAGKKKTLSRFNWLAPFMISRHNPAVLYMGANRFFKSTNRGNSWQAISPDLTRKKHIEGNEPYATITAIDESPFDPAVLYAGSDDGNIWLSQNSGANWKQINSVLPKKWVTRIIASRHKKEQVYVTLSGRSEDNFRTYVFVSLDFGVNWRSLKGNLPDEPVNVIREDPWNSDILYLGTDLSIYAALDAGETWHSLKNNLPTNAVYDIRVHPRDRELIIGTHGRGVFVLPVSTIQQLTPKILRRPLFLFEIDSVDLGRRPGPGSKKVKIEYYTPRSTKVVLRIRKAGKNIKKIDLDATAGLNVFYWDMVIDKVKKTKAEPGDYRVIARTGGAQIERTFRINK